MELDTEYSTVLILNLTNIFLKITYLDKYGTKISKCFVFHETWCKCFSRVLILNSIIDSLSSVPNTKTLIAQGDI